MTTTTHGQSGAGDTSTHDASNSQDSSFAETSASQRSQFAPSSAGLLEPFQVYATRDADTPSTSLSNYSSQENAVDGRRSREGAESAQGESVAQAEPAQPGNSITGMARKRLANGEIKSSTQGSLPMSPIESGRCGHSRQASSASRGSQIGEMSERLRARLSYAAVKVQKGWEGYNINELEQHFATSGYGSPISATSHGAREYDTPTTNDSPIDYSFAAQMPRQIAVSTSFSSPQRHAATRSYANYPNLADSAITAPIAQPNQTYEQFWQEHSHNALPQSRRTDAPSLNAPSLAPPVEFSPRNALAARQNPPQIHTAQPFPGQLPSTPPSRGGTLAKMRTPSQQAGVEKEVVETLLFMSSPGNSQHFPSTRAPEQRPLQGQPPPIMPLNGILKGESATVKGPARGPRELNDAEINKMLDEMPESSDSEEEEEEVLLGRVAPKVHGL